MPYAADDFAAIRAALYAHRADAIPRCPIASDRTLYNSLRSPARCGDTCPHRDAWIGPEENANAASAAAGAYC